jgi:DNA-binding PadR family transcriptional regulator
MWANMTNSQLNLENYATDFSRFYILTILYEGPQYGYSILKAFKERLRKEASPSLIYPFLKQMEQKGFVIHTLKPVGAKKKKVFELTMEGKKFCQQLFRQFSELVYVAIESNLTACAHCGCKLFEGGHKEAINGKELTFCCIHCAGSYRKCHL